MIEDILQGQSRISYYGLPVKKKRGRPRRETPRTREEINASARESRKRNQTKNVTLNANALSLLQRQQKVLSEKIGTKLTLTQTLELTLKHLNFRDAEGAE